MDVYRGVLKWFASRVQKRAGRCNMGCREREDSHLVCWLLANGSRVSTLEGRYGHPKRQVY